MSPRHVADVLGWVSAQACSRRCPNVVFIDTNDYAHLSAEQIVRKTVGPIHRLNGWPFDAKSQELLELHSCFGSDVVRHCAA